MVGACTAQVDASTSQVDSSISRGGIHTATRVTPFGLSAYSPGIAGSSIDLCRRAGVASRSGPREPVSRTKRREPRAELPSDERPSGTVSRGQGPEARDQRRAATPAVQRACNATHRNATAWNGMAWHGLPPGGPLGNEGAALLLERARRSRAERRCGSQGRLPSGDVVITSRKARAAATAAAESPTTARPRALHSWAKSGSCCNGGRNR